jgi:hypothetical protein
MNTVHSRHQNHRLFLKLKCKFERNVLFFGKLKCYLESSYLLANPVKLLKSLYFS